MRMTWSSFVHIVLVFNRVCSQYGLDFDITYNSKKSNIMIVRSREDSKLSFPAFYLSGTLFKVCDEVKYLGHYITDDLSDDRDIHRQYRMISVV